MRPLIPSLLLAAAGSTLILPHAHARAYASTVVEYQPGTGFATEWPTGAGYTNQSAILGPPSQFTVDPDPAFGGTFPVDPFSPAYLRTQLLSIGEGGSVTFELGQPALNDPTHLFGIDFIVFGSAGFVITNGNFTGGGITDGSLFGAQTGTTRVEVSADGTRFYELAPSLAPVLDALFPTDGAGDFFKPVNPLLGEADFNGRDLESIRGLYAGSAGGAGYDLAWARDAAGNPVELGSASHVRLSVITGHAEVDAVVVVPEPGAGALLLAGLFGLAVAGGRSRRSAPTGCAPR